MQNDTDEGCRDIDSSDRGKQTFTDTKSNQQTKFDEIMSIHSKRENLTVLCLNRSMLHITIQASLCRCACYSYVRGGKP